MGLWPIPGPSGRDGHTSGFFDLMVIVAHDGVDVCDGAHGRFVMKKVKGSAPPKLEWSTLQSWDERDVRAARTAPRSVVC